MTLTIQLFAKAKELAEANSVTVEISEGATVHRLRERLAENFPKLANVVARSALAVNHEFAEDSLVLKSSDEIAIIPPVSGG